MPRPCHYTLYTNHPLGLVRAPSFRRPGRSEGDGVAYPCPHPVTEILSEDTPACAEHAQMAREMRAAHKSPLDD